MRNIRVIPNNPEFKGLAEMVGDIQFAAPDGHPLTLHLIKPWGQITTRGGSRQRREDAQDQIRVQDRVEGWLRTSSGL